MYSLCWKGKLKIFLKKIKSTPTPISLVWKENMPGFKLRKVKMQVEQGEIGTQIKILYQLDIPPPHTHTLSRMYTHKNTNIYRNWHKSKRWRIANSFKIGGHKFICKPIGKQQQQEKPQIWRIRFKFAYLSAICCKGSFRLKGSLVPKFKKVARVSAKMLTSTFSSMFNSKVSFGGNNRKYART